MKKVLLLIMVIALCFTFTACKAEVNVYLDESDEAFTDDNSSVDDTEDITDTESATSSDDEGMQAPAENNNASDDKSEGKKPTGSTDDKKPASSGGQSGTTPTPMPSGSAEQEYTVTFNSNGGSAVSAAKTVGGKVTKPADPTRAGYKFLGWYKQGSSTAWNFGDKVTADITLVATWEVIEYNVTFDSAGGSAVAAAKTSGQVTKPADPTRAGYIFAGWYKQGSSTAWNFGDKVTADITLVAKWEIVEYTVTFVFDNGENDNESYSTVNHKVVTKPADPTRAGYIFAGWYKQGSSTAWNFGDKVTADITLVVKWEIVEYTVTFIFNNDENNNEIYSTVNHKVVTKPADPEKKNCKFTGWYNQSTGKKWDFDDETFADLVLVADWTIAGDHSPIIPFD